MEVAVLGCGPAGLAAAHGAVQAGATVRIYSKKRKSELFGAQYLHAPIPGMTDTPPVAVNYCVNGTHEQYRSKVYGPLAPQVPVVSTQSLSGTHDAWDIRRTYDNLWTEYNERIFDSTLNATWLDECVDSGLFDVVLSTVPLPALCVRKHTFLGADVWAMGDAPERGRFVPRVLRAPHNEIVCSGEPAVAWYRQATVYGHATVEWPYAAFTPTVGAARDGVVSRVRKPISTDCTCWENTVYRLGRYGAWDKAQLSHHAYTAAVEICSSVAV